MIKKIVVIASVLSFIITCGIFGLRSYLRHSTIPHYEKKLLTIADAREQEISIYLNDQQNNAEKLSEESAIINALTASDSSAENIITPLLAAHKETMGFKNIILTNTTGTIVFSTTKKNIVGTNITQDSSNSSFGKSYERASMTLTNDFSNFNFNTLLQEPALFITIPLLKDKKFIGTLSYQLDQDKIYLITNQYIGLEKTGEVVLAKKEDNSIVFVAPTRNDPDLAFKKRPLFSNPPIAVQASILGQEGSGTAIDYRGNNIVGAWKFIPKLDWGMIVKIDLNEILQTTNTIYYIFLLSAFIFLLLLVITTYLYYPQLRNKLNTINHSYPCNKIPSLLKNVLFLLCLIFSGLTIKSIIQCKMNTSAAIEKAKMNAQKNSSKNTENIESILEKIAFVGQSIAKDLHTNYLAKDDIGARIQRDLLENNIITEITVLFEPYTFDASTELYIQSTSTTTYTNNIFKTKWYTQAIENGSTWIINTNKDEPSTNPTATYACVFLNKDNKPQGAIAITFALKTIIDIAEYSGIGQTGYSMIMASNGAFIYHPLNNLVQTETTLAQYAQSKGNDELATIAQKVTDGNAHMLSYKSESNKERFWIYTQPIKVNNWTIGSLFSEDEVELPAQTIRHYHFWILAWATIVLLLAFGLLCQYGFLAVTYYAIIANIILIAALMTAWYVIQETTTINRESRTIITDQSNLNKFLNDLSDEAERKHETKPINIPCGILIYSIATSGVDNITLSGYIWTKYNIEQHKNITRGIELPQATRMTFGKPLTVESDNGEETTTWNIQGIMYQEQNYTLYPFDQQRIRIILEHKDIEKNIILTPDLVAYKKISPEAIPGLDKEFSFTGFTIEQAFFEYHKIDPATNFGFKEFGKVTDDYQLVYNAIMNRNLSNPFILYLLPLLVILFSLFTTLLIARKTTEPLSVLAGYTGLFFAMIVLQRSLREAHPSGATLYMEYAFFYTYITIILLILHTILMYYHKRWNEYQDKALYFMRLLFWPFQFVSWIITTLIIFY